jgi:3-oxoacyl-[acyl-carrier protein] reductase
VSGIYKDLEGKVAVVLGGSEGIGGATARMLAANGVKVAVGARRREPLEALVEEVGEEGGEAFPLQLDATRTADLERARDATVEHFGGIDILIAFAGGGATRIAVEEIDDETWSSVIERNLTATFLAVRAFVPTLQKGHAPAIVTMGSAAGRQIDAPLSAAYAAAKAGVAQFTRHIAAELGPRGIRANCVAPSITLSPRIRESLKGKPGLEDAVLGITPLGRLGEPSDIADAAVYLCSDASGWLTGATLDLGGGRVMR